MSDTRDTLLAADDPAPVTLYNETGASPFLIVADHAGNRFPRALGRLGVTEADCQRHIAWDIGIAPVSRRLAEALDATLIEQTYSRLVIDCNRPPGRKTSIPETSEATPVPGNTGLSERDMISARARYLPALPRRHRTGAQSLAAGRQAGSADRDAQLYACLPWRGAALACRMLYNRDRRFAGPLLALLKREPGWWSGTRALRRERRHRLHHSGARRAARPASHRDRGSPEPDHHRAGPRLVARLARLLPQAYRDLLASEAPRG